MNKKAARIGLYFYVPITFIALIYPKKFIGNTYLLMAYLAICLIFIYFIFRKKKTADKEQP